MFGEIIDLGDGNFYFDKIVKMSENLKKEFLAVFEEFGMPKFAIMLGTSGPKSLLTMMDPKKIVLYKKIGFPVSKVKGHEPNGDGPEAKIHYGTLEGVPVLICVGRVHYFEGYSMDYVTLMIRSICLLGIKDYILTNASGALVSPDRRDWFDVGSIKVVDGFVNHMGDSPLRGEFDYFHGFADPNKVLHQDFIKKGKEISGQYKSHNCTYIAVAGPAFETYAEAEVFCRMGHLMGMSSVPELLALAKLSARALVLSLVTNIVSTSTWKHDTTHEKNLEIVQKNDGRSSKIILDFVKSFKE